ncbi:triosephosphate isomerase [Thiohalospira halophila DSM 15071]|uniref:Triosephosphate isomerase n=1 Tax=Thiohalospira halophila DSM 15071 TaxID=1123397 RepID=A0A1I1VX78_9GAMM|nr:triose-phosphate isomerase [Thiohalospira halophila]SFD85643.1 triosephosphate isomerase [Thiohalospira halophila DSM 15071]
MRQPLVAGNWKMNGDRATNEALLNGIKAGIGDVEQSEVAVCAPFVYLADVQRQLEASPIRWGSQDVSAEPKGAFTGEVSVTMLKDFGCHYAIVGHSERRSLHGEDNDTVARKFAAAREGGIRPILCVGETLAEREADTTEQVVGAQLDAVMDAVGPAALADGVIAYEPVWAIGTGHTATPEQAQAMHAFIRQRVADRDAATADALRILYGGSMKGANAAELMAQSDIDGGLIGGASLDADEFLTICRAAG